MPTDPRTGKHVDSLPSMDRAGNVTTARELRRTAKFLRQHAGTMTATVGEVHPPHQDSVLAALDASAFPREVPSVIVMNALVSACAHLTAAHDFAKVKSANRITAWSLLRPALMSATTAGWLLLAADNGERLRRAAIASNEAMRYELAYADNVANVDGGQVAERRAWIEERLTGLAAWATAAGVTLRPRDRLPMTEAVREVADAVGSSAPRMSAWWNEMSSGAHGLGWHIQSRTFGAGTSPLDGSNFVRFPVELDLANYIGAVADITDYADRVLAVARTLATDPETLKANGTISLDVDGRTVLRLAIMPILDNDGALPSQ